ncbi:polyketide beta-ketoacyl-synthase [Flagelloscypha sp. PMI_526]|nr:polyketide beta-ketoacyl-synthase [Flagelloscypha sp. PMI_526]
MESKKRPVHKPHRSRSWASIFREPDQEETVTVPFFAGHGTSKANSSQSRSQALLDAESDTGRYLLNCCHAAFLLEIRSLPSQEMAVLGIDLTEFSAVESLLLQPPSRNSVVSGCALFLIQILRYQAFVLGWNDVARSVTPFSDILKENARHSVGVLGFSSGILPACVAAVSASIHEYVVQAVEVFRLIIWIGVRCQLYKVKKGLAKSVLPWSCVFPRLSFEDAERTIAAFLETTEDLLSPLSVTAVLTEGVTISGHPELLDKLRTDHYSSLTHHDTQVDTLYHSEALRDTMTLVLDDAARRKINIPDLSQLIVPLRSTINGHLITHSSSESLLSSLLSMVLTEPVRWDPTVSELSADIARLPHSTCYRLLNLGPGFSLLRSLDHVFPKDRTSLVEFSATSDVSSILPLPVQIHQEPIAIVGMSLRLPGSGTLSEFWDLLENGHNTISEIPKHRFDVDLYATSPSQFSGRFMRARHGNFLDGVDEFDNVFFGINRREARQMDPQHRILLQVSHEALEHAGWVRNATPTSSPERVGCFIGGATHDYRQNLRNNIDVHYSPGTLGAFLSGRISHAMKFSGPSVSCDTACSSSAVSIQQACRALMNHDCDTALAGGVNVISSPDMFLGLDRGHFLSPTGQCRPFDDSADGYARGEGCVVFVLKRLPDAKADNDRILAVIRGVEVNQSGCASSVTQPHGMTQSALFRQLLNKARIDPFRVNVVEAHGTGTQAGDPTELASIREVFAIRRPNDNPLHITALKGNIGHSEAASGAASLAKVVLMMHRGQIPPTVSFKTLNTKIVPLSSDNVVIDTVLTPWYPSHPNHPRIAALNNFGAAGSNVAMIVEEFVLDSSISVMPLKYPYVFGLSAKTLVALESQRSRFIAWLSSSDFSEDLASVAYSMTARREMYSFRISVYASQKAELIQKLETAAPKATANTSSPNKVVFVFSGQGGQHIGMGRGLYETNSFFRNQVHECDLILTTLGFPSVLPIISPTLHDDIPEVQRWESFQPAVFVLEYSLARLWIEIGVTPSAVVGHSLGEYAGFVIANVMSLRDALYVVARRAQLMIQKAALEHTGMLAVTLSPDIVQSILSNDEAYEGVTISCFNSPSDCVLSGPLSQLRYLKGVLDSERRSQQILLDVPFGYHSQAMDPILTDLDSLALNINLRPPSIPILSNVSGRMVWPGDPCPFDSNYISRHCRQAVHFEQGVRHLVSHSNFNSSVIWLEIGPHVTCLPMLRTHDAISFDSLFLPSMKRSQNSCLTFTSTLCQLYQANVCVQWRAAFSTTTISHTLVDLPHYPWSKDKFWIPFEETGISPTPSTQPTERHSPNRKLTDFTVLSECLQFPSDPSNGTAVFETPISNICQFIEGHKVTDTPLAPASLYLEFILAAVAMIQGKENSSNDSVTILRNVEFTKPLVYRPDSLVSIRVTLRIKQDKGTFIVASSPLSCNGAEYCAHAKGEYRLLPFSKAEAKLRRSLPVILRQLEAVKQSKHGQDPDVISPHTAYQQVFPRVVKYSREYQVMQGLTIAVGGMEGLADLKFPPSVSSSPQFVVHPIIADALFHVPGLVSNMHGSAEHAYICHQVGSVKIMAPRLDPTKKMNVYCTNSWMSSEKVMYSTAYCIQHDQDGSHLVAYIEDMAFRRLKLVNLRKSLRDARSTHPKSSRSRLSPFLLSLPTEIVERQHALTILLSFGLETRPLLVVYMRLSWDSSLVYWRRTLTRSEVTQLLTCWAWTPSLLLNFTAACAQDFPTLIFLPDLSLFALLWTT